MLDTLEKQRSTPTVVPGAALPWQVLGRVGGYDHPCGSFGTLILSHCQLLNMDIHCLVVTGTCFIHPHIGNNHPK